MHVLALQVQDESAGLVVLLLDPQPGERILDACAAPGGKALFAAARMRGQVVLIPTFAKDIPPNLDQKQCKYRWTGASASGTMQPC